MVDVPQHRAAGLRRRASPRNDDISRHEHGVGIDAEVNNPLRARIGRIRAELSVAQLRPFAGVRDELNILDDHGERAIVRVRADAARGGAKRTRIRPRRWKCDEQWSSRFRQRPTRRFALGLQWLTVYRHSWVAIPVVLFCLSFGELVERLGEFPI